jgi:hypothetical protein
LLDLAKAWEMADTLASNNLAKQLPSMAPYLTASAKSGMDFHLRLSGFCVLCFLTEDRVPFWFPYIA